METKIMYARKLTKTELINDGITRVTYDGRVFRGENEALPMVSRTGYFIHNIFDLDENGKRITVPNEKSAFGYNYKTRTIGLHRLMWAWFHDEVPEGMVIDHINNKHNTIEDYRLDNLQLLTPSENIRKNRDESTLEVKCKMDRPRSYYEEKLEQAIGEYEKAKLAKEAEHVHSIRSKVFQARARLRFWDSHKEEIEKNIAAKAAEAERKALKAKKQAYVGALKALASKAKEMNNYSLWHEILAVAKDYDNYTEKQLKQLIKKYEVK
jgi:hypothetical protein